jgi:AraC-like DNA-binding protein
VRFGEDFAGIICAAHDIDVAVPAADAKMTRYVQQYLDTLVSRRNTTMSANVRECIYTMLPSGLCSADTVAGRLGVDRRTVHRHLAREGKTFSAIMDAVRAELVTRYIDNRDRPLVSVAELLGFSALSAFSRWFRRQFGCSVSQWRAGPPASARTGTPRVEARAGG